MKKLLAGILVVVLGSVGFIATQYHRPNCADTFMSEFTTQSQFDRKHLKFEKVQGSGAWNCLNGGVQVGLSIWTGVTNDNELQGFIKASFGSFDNLTYEGYLEEGPDKLYLYRATDNIDLHVLVNEASFSDVVRDGSDGIMAYIDYKFRHNPPRLILVHRQITMDLYVHLDDKGKVDDLITTP